ncbi:MAG: 2-hydroxyglutaryl-CoA dehydratase [Planctomycetes bacterium]|nr:2-hydroxyglutaryl-CoA dehydratase [Planctomycetota bacterium]MCB9935597.1 2-hydroxyglutaryl-CoA dehydratase [Planctomycetota bacterium]
MTPNDVLEAKVEEELKAYEAELRKELGLEDENINHFEKPVEHAFLRQSRETTTVLFGGLTMAHDQLIKRAVAGLGYKVDPLEVPDNEALALGKEFGNRGQCNPTYYTVGNLVKFLQNLRDNQGLSVPEIKEKYVFLTAGACGPCRFGMYEAEYRKALRDAGFEGFRVLLFEQSKGISQAAGDEEADEGGIDFNKDFFMAIIAALLVGDLLNDLGYQVRPYERKAGETDRVLDQAKKLMGDAMEKAEKLEPALKKVRALFDTIECDFTRVKPKVKITGEFWAMTTEGDGNYHMARWLESEGAQVLVEPVSTWVDYLLYIAKHDLKAAWGVPDKDGNKFSAVKAVKTYALISALKMYFRGRYDKYRKLLGMKPNALPDQKKIHKLAQQYYNIDLRGGEGHMEVGKNIYSVLEKKAHMVISVKPFGCMPSTQSDGVQSKVVNDYPECIFIPIETSGDGEVNIKSRVQMKLYEAKVRCREEFARVLDGYGFSVQQFRDYVDSHPEFSNSLVNLPHEEVGVASNLLHMVAKRMKAHYSKKVDKLMSVQEVEKLAREAAQAEGAACVAEETEEAFCSSGSCGDSLPGEQKDRTPAETVQAATGGSCGDSCGCE